jgi:hypothetical protein
MLMRQVFRIYTRIAVNFKFSSGDVEKKFNNCIINK